MCYADTPASSNTLAQTRQTGRYHVNRVLMRQSCSKYATYETDITSLLVPGYISHHAVMLFCL